MAGLPEEVLRRIWETRINSRTHLTTSTGLPLCVIESGALNENAGPDFLNALVRIGTRTFRGDVEIHGSPDAWYAHHHNTDPHYNRVILHVVESCPRTSKPVRTRSRRAIPLLILNRNFPDLSAIARQIDLRKRGGDDLQPRGDRQRMMCGHRWNPDNRGRMQGTLKHVQGNRENAQGNHECMPGNRGGVQGTHARVQGGHEWAPPDYRLRWCICNTILLRLNRSRDPRALLRRKGMQRIQNRMQRLEHRLQQILAEEEGVLCEPQAYYEGHPDEIPLSLPSWTQRELKRESAWEQILYEGFLEALGYSRNTEAFLSLARNVPLSMLRGMGLKDTHRMMALLFGSAGLLPPPRGSRDRESRRYLRRLRDTWGILQQGVMLPRLHAADWLFFRLRPANFPTARLAAFVFLLPGLFEESGFAQMRAVVKLRALPPRKQLTLLRCFFRVEPDGYWRHHLHFRGGVSGLGASIGRARVDAILLNCVLPLVMLYGQIAGEARLVRNGRRLLAVLPAGHETRVLEGVRRLLLPEGGQRLSALEQQGVKQLWNELQTDRTVHPLCSTH